jgi:hypothetical protein
MPSICVALEEMRFLGDRETRDKSRGGEFVRKFLCATTSFPSPRVATLFLKKQKERVGLELALAPKKNIPPPIPGVFPSLDQEIGYMKVRGGGKG